LPLSDKPKIPAHLLNQEWVSLTAFARITHKAYSTCVALFAAGEIKGATVGTHRQVPMTEVLRFLREGNASASPQIDEADPLKAHRNMLLDKIQNYKEPK